MSQQSPADRLSVGPSVVMAILNALEGGNLVHLRRDPTHRRRRIVEITTEGSAAFDTLETAPTRAESGLFAEPSDQERTTLRALLNRVASTSGDYVCRVTV
ncbi:hypothetical protein ACFRIB_54675 [Streptomyces mirabilis]|uniref:hypothetical protein n=1 Tax=Streptomyces mirabilis TaxID=68239 RepID=UPI00369F4F29